MSCFNLGDILNVKLLVTVKSDMSSKVRAISFTFVHLWNVFYNLTFDILLVTPAGVALLDELHNSTTGN